MQGEGSPGDCAGCVRFTCRLWSDCWPQRKCSATTANDPAATDCHLLRTAFSSPLDDVTLFRRRMAQQQEHFVHLLRRRRESINKPVAPASAHDDITGLRREEGREKASLHHRVARRTSEGTGRKHACRTPLSVPLTTKSPLLSWWELAAQENEEKESLDHKNNREVCLFACRHDS